MPKVPKTQLFLLQIPTALFLSLTKFNLNELCIILPFSTVQESSRDDVTVHDGKTLFKYAAQLHENFT